MTTRARTRLLAGAMTLMVGAGLASAVSAPSAEARAATDRVYSRAMHRSIPVYVVPANRPNAPTIYLLDGLRAPANDTGWLINTNVANFMRGKGVNLVMPFGGAGSFYTDWQQRDPKLGLNRWETFLTRELPRYMKSKYQSDGVRNGIGGLSMSGTSALNIASRHASMYKSVASYSGYPTVTMPGFNQGIQMSVAEVGGNPVNMWGMFPGGDWFANDPFLSAGNLAGKWVYVSSGTGITSKYDSAINPGSPNFDPMRFVQMVPLETAASISSQLYIARLRTVGVHLTTHISPDGGHWWDYWQRRFKESWYTTYKPSFFGGAGGNNNLGSGSLGSLGSTGSGS
ncbi:MAG TPA: alpha/beta hydrolase family protein [Gordonia sp. (in: high G+C Gram-positive bacteria)]|uniref:alpha/beta hydrolase n=1 Tax=unclassified Gordonia (in: high G+C Gram-positive bacteria) TaxID=2657482 RepID=UPI000F9E8172|nr:MULTISPECIES: alpha/beta hydrolase family protein [unclassified Gordonia (in: high G+C Gram-positive bacteria)]RUP40289.1 MAG: esterase family protein [Gordonia sp. (in: high G+C Gram-positive bacteria)]HNP57243.1 alpha/beta hydrolase family protein [Gordonia sp. (in: high G+C Gram-positive bacteria)]HRC49307.1 alpha/beta hydrolase family protein [Gordonia sp. (in: high G+C Gram-positive bacteria)]